MKLKYLLMSALACFAMLSCQKENDSGDFDANNNGGEKYMAVRFAMRGTDTRATGDYVNGTTAEDSVKRAMFMFFDGENQVADPYLATSGFVWTTNPTGNNVEKYSGAIIVLSNPVRNPTSILAILNPSDALAGQLTRGKTLAEIQAIRDKYDTTGFIENEKFVMANSVYSPDGSVIQYCTPLVEANLGNSEAEALANPVNIYVERAVAKVDVKESSNFHSSTGVLSGSDSIRFTVNKWWIDNEPATSTLLKPLSSSYSLFDSYNDPDWWNAPSDFRSFWADKNNAPYYRHYAPNDDNEDNVADLDATLYTLENPIQKQTDSDTSNATQVVVEGTLSVGDATDPTAFVKYLSTVYTKDDFETLLFNAIMVDSLYYYDENTTSYKTLPETAFIFDYAHNTDTGTVSYNGTAIKDYEAVVTAKAMKDDTNEYDNTEIYRNTGTAASPQMDTLTEAALDSALAQAYKKVQYFKDGKTYYYFKIVHNPDITFTPSGHKAHGLYGVIRNHLYKITLGGVKGLGTAIPGDGDEIIIPVTPTDENTYIAATINILAYREVDMDDVTLGE
jgi:hypothetical protein